MSELEVARASGVALGLTREQCDEVIDAWTDWYRGVDREINYRAIKSRIIDRSWHGSWQPPSEELTPLAISFGALMGVPVEQAAATLQTAMRAKGVRA